MQREKLAMSQVTAEELRQLRRRQPFQPFRVHLKNGETYDVLDALEFGVGGNVVGLPVHHSSDPDKDSGVSVTIDQIDRIELRDLIYVNARSL
jgi:hypothetical protein